MGISLRGSAGHGEEMPNGQQDHGNRVQGKGQDWARIWEMMHENDR